MTMSYYMNAKKGLLIRSKLELANYVVRRKKLIRDVNVLMFQRNFVQLPFIIRTARPRQSTRGALRAVLM